MRVKYSTYFHVFFVVVFLFSLNVMGVAQLPTNNGSDGLDKRIMPGDTRGRNGQWEDPRFKPAPSSPTNPTIIKKPGISYNSKDKDKEVKRALKVAAAFLKEGSGFYNLALSWYEYAATLDSKSVYAFVGLGKTYIKLKRYKEADVAFNQALRLNPKMVEAMIGLSETYYRQQFYDEAINLCKQALALELKSVEAYIMLGNIYFAKKLYSETIAAYENAIKLNPKSVEAHFNCCCK